MVRVPLAVLGVVIAYATTIHKAMGSEYETVIMPLLKAHTVMLYANAPVLHQKADELPVDPAAWVVHHLFNL